MVHASERGRTSRLGMTSEEQHEGATCGYVALVEVRMDEEI